MSKAMNFRTMPVLTKDEQDELALQAKHGNDAAGRRLIESNLLLILKEMHKMIDRFDWDVFRAGVHGMDIAIDKFEIEKGHFTHYAMHYVRNKMRRARRAARLVHVPLGTTQYLWESEQGKREVTPRMQKTISAYYRTLNVHGMDVPFYADGQTPADVLQAEQLDPGASAIKTFDLEAHKPALDKLDERSQMIVRLRFGIGMKKETLKKIADIIGISRERVRQRQNAALDKLRELMNPPEKKE